MIAVDVLAVLDQAVADRAQWLPSGGHDLAGKITSDEANPIHVRNRQRHAEAVAARAAIAELIEVARDSRDSLSAANKVYADGGIGLLIERLSAAVANVSGGA